MLRDHLCVKPLQADKPAVLILEWHGEPVRGVVVFAGPGCYPNIHERGEKDGKPYRKVRQAARFRPTEVRPGDIVELGGREIGGYLFQQILIGNELHVLCREQDVCFIEDEGRFVA